MKDLMGIEIQDGDIVADIRTNYAWVEPGVITGGLTASGKIRFLSWRGKGHTQEKFLLKITPQQAKDFLINKFDNDIPVSVQNFIEQILEPRL